MHWVSQSWPNLITTNLSVSLRIAWSTSQPLSRWGRTYDIYKRVNYIIIGLSKIFIYIKNKKAIKLRESLFLIWNHDRVIPRVHSLKLEYALNYYYILIVFSIMKAIEVRLVGRFRFERKIPGEHDHLLYMGVHTQNDSYVFMKGD